MHMESFSAPTMTEAMETAAVALKFSSIGAEKLVITRLYMTRRLGSILTAAHTGRLSLSDISITPSIAKGMSPINPVSLAYIIMPCTDAVKIGSTNRLSQIKNRTEAML